MDRRTALRGGAATIGALAITAVASGNLAAATEGQHSGLLPNPATDPVPNPPFPRNLTRTERQHLEVFDELDFDVFTNNDWGRLGDTDGIDKHTEDLAAMFVWAPDTRIKSHFLRVAKNELTAVTGTMQGTFTRPRPDGKGGFTQPTGRKYSIAMTTVSIWNRRGTMDEEFLFWDDQNFNQQLGLT